ncbi:MAG: 2-C-methyl-D-erythritol 4-phosphate cytidylyltransferase [Balneolaceae bacterium]
MQCSLSNRYFVANLALIIPAAGSGTRMQCSVPKPYIKIADKTILGHTLSCFKDISSINQIIISTTEEFNLESVKIAESIFPGISIACAKGGKERQDSIRNALDLLMDDVDYVIVHDAVRPFIRTNTILECIKAAKEAKAAIVAVPVKDTVKVVNKDLFIESTPQRNELWNAQTPQIFEKKLLLRAYSHSKKIRFIGTDDASLVEKMGETVKIVEGSRENIKITYPLDMRLAKNLLED